MSTGVTLCYANPHTLSATGVKLKLPESKGDFEVSRPHSLLFAPAVLEKAYNGLNLLFASGIKKKIFDGIRLVGNANAATHDHGCCPSDFAFQFFVMHTALATNHSILPLWMI